MALAAGRATPAPPPGGIVPRAEARHAVERVLALAADLGVAFADVFVEETAHDELRYEDRRTEQARAGAELGVGIRLVRDGRVAYTVASSLDPRVLLPLVADAVAGLRLGAGPGVSPVTTTRRGCRAVERLCDQPLPELAHDQLIAELTRIDRYARAASPWIRRVDIQFLSHRRHVLVANSEGLCRAEPRRFSRVSVQAVAARGDLIRTGVNNVARTLGEAELFARYPAAALGREVGAMAETMLDAAAAPTGALPVVVGNGRGGVLVHEACVHCLEADYVSRENSVYRGRLGEVVAQPQVTVIDDGTVPGQAGTYAMDDEGNPARRNVLVASGRLQSYLSDRTYAHVLGQPATGSGRRQSHAFLPMPRMTNTFVAPGDDTPDEIVAATPRGVYARRVSGGQVNPMTGEFVFTVNEGYLIEGGRLTRPLVPFTLTGNGPEVLRNIDRVGHDFDLAAAMCGKSGQMVPVSVGQPTIRVREMVVGGTGR
ncbi:MAG TPA: TldD/PmbA family protein [Chloroflexota bacterium]|nr:TldD/PmbA family protein [Chloroflexota bacterium]